VIALGARPDEPEATGRWSVIARQTAVLIAVGIAARLVLAAVLGLGVDESYEVVLSRVPSLGYFDHPPLSFWIAGAAARLTDSENRVVLRLPFVVIFGCSTFLLYRLTARLYGERAGFVAALLLNLSPVFSISTGGWILPDGPLDCAILAATLCLTRVLPACEDRRPWRWWMGAGAATGLALLSKYHGVFVPFGVLLFIATHAESRRWLRRPGPYLGAAVAVVVAMPMLIWNASHHFASFRFQAGRAASHGLHPTALLQNVAGQLGYLLPWIAVPLLWQLARGLRAGPRDPVRWLLCCLAIGPIVVFTLVSLGGNRGLPHWAAPGYLLLLPLLGDAMARYEQRGQRERSLIRRALIAMATSFVVLVAIAASAVATGWPARVAPALFRRGDPSLEALDWSDLRPELARLGLLTGKNDVVVATHWIDAAKIGYALGPSHPVLCFSDDPRGFPYVYPAVDFVGGDAVVLVRTGRGAVGDALSHVVPYFRSIEQVGTAQIRRAGRVEIEIAAFRARQLLRPRP
jgi:4-amino-4-deoxy-L-arabinose transferase-like glycosyltransferase